MVNGDAEGVFPTHPLSLPRPGHSLHSDATAYGLPPSSVPTASVQTPASKIAVIPLGVGSGIATGNVAVPGAEDATPTYSVTGYGGSPSKVLPNRAIVQVDAHGDWAYIPAIDSGQEGVIRDSSFTVYGIDDRGVKTKTVVTVTTHDLDVGYRTTVGNGSVTGRLSVPDGVLVFSPGIGPGKGSLQTNANGTFLYTASDDVAHGETQTFTIVGTNAFGNVLTVAALSLVPKPNGEPTHVRPGAVKPFEVDSIGIVRGHVHGSDPTADGPGMTYSVTDHGGAASAKLGSGAIVNVDASGRWTYIPPSAGEVLADSFTIYVSGRDGAKTTASVRLAMPKMLDIGYRTTLSGDNQVYGSLLVPAADKGLLTFAKAGDAPDGVSVSADGTFTYIGETAAAFDVVGTAFGQATVVARINATPAAAATAAVDAGLTEVTVGGSGRRTVFTPTGEWTTTVTDPNGGVIADVGASRYGAGVGYVVAQPKAKGTVTVSRTATGAGPATSTFVIGYESTSAPTAGFYPTETFTVTFYDARGASVAKSYTF